VNEYNPVEFGELKARVASLSEEVLELKAMLKEQNTLIGSLLQKVTTAEGGLRTLLMIGGAGASLGALLSWITAHLRFD
jgi:hypothetical protein